MSLVKQPRNWSQIDKQIDYQMGRYQQSLYETSCITKPKPESVWGGRRRDPPAAEGESAEAEEDSDQHRRRSGESNWTARSTAYLWNSCKLKAGLYLKGVTLPLLLSLPFLSPSLAFPLSLSLLASSLSLPCFPSLVLPLRPFLFYPSLSLPSFLITLLTPGFPPFLFPSHFPSSLCLPSYFLCKITLIILTSAFIKFFVESRISYIMSD